MPARPLAYVFRLAMAALLLAGSLTTHASPGAGLVILSRNQVDAISDSATRLLARRDPVYSGERVQTAADASVSMRFGDGSVVSLDPSTQLDIRAYNYGQGEGGSPDSLILELVSGSFRSLTGAISKINPQAYEVKTPLASLSIRGTFFLAQLNPDRTELSVFVWEGRVVIENEFGSLTLLAGEGSITLQGNAPVKSNQLGDLASLSRAQIGPEFTDELDEDASRRNALVNPGATGGGEGGNGGGTDDGLPPMTLPEDGDEDGSPFIGVEPDIDPSEPGVTGDVGGTVYAPGLPEEGQEIGADKIIDNLQ